MTSRKELLLSLKICAILDRDALPEYLIREKGVTSIQIRRKNVKSIDLIKKVKHIKRKSKIPIFINDRADVAFASDCCGIHVGTGDMPVRLLKKMLDNSFIIGKTVRNSHQAKIAKSERVSYISIGPIYKTPTKDFIKPKGIKIINRIKKASRLPLVAIGGVNFSNKDKIMSYGADGVAMVRAIAKLVKNN